MKDSIKSGEVNAKPIEKEEQFQLLMSQFNSIDNQYKPTSEQVDKMLSLQEKGMDYTHDERSRVLPQHKFDKQLETILVVAGMIVLLLVFILVLAFKPDLTNIVVTAIIAFIGGYGIGNQRAFKKKDQDMSD